MPATRRIASVPPAARLAREQLGHGLDFHEGAVRQPVGPVEHDDAVLNLSPILHFADLQSRLYRRLGRLSRNLAARTRGGGGVDALIRPDIGGDDSVPGPTPPCAATPRPRPGRQRWRRCKSAAFRCRSAMLSTGALPRRGHRYRRCIRRSPPAFATRAPPAPYLPGRALCTTSPAATHRI